MQLTIGGRRVTIDDVADSGTIRIDLVYETTDVRATLCVTTDELDEDTIESKINDELDRRGHHMITKINDIVVSEETILYRDGDPDITP